MKPRKPIRRKKPLPRNRKPISKSGKRLVRQALRPRSTGKSRFPSLRSSEYLGFIHSLPCILTGRTPSDGLLHQCWGRVEASHVRSRGAAGADEGNLVPLCAKGHASQHLNGIKTWATRWFGENGLEELRRIAAEVYPGQYQRALDLGWKPGGEF